MTADATRFANVSTAELAQREREAIAEYHQIASTLRLRLLAECPVNVGRIYKVTGGAYSGRRMKVVHVGVAPYWPDIATAPYVEVHGRLNIIDVRTTPTGDDFGRRIAVVSPSVLVAE